MTAAKDRKRLLIWRACCASSVSALPRRRGVAGTIASVRSCSKFSCASARAGAGLALGLAYRRRWGAFGAAKLAGVVHHALNGSGSDELPVAPLEYLCGWGCAGCK